MNKQVSQRKPESSMTINSSQPNPMPLGMRLVAYLFSSSTAGFLFAARVAGFFFVDAQDAFSEKMVDWVLLTLSFSFVAVPAAIFGGFLPWLLGHMALQWLNLRSLPFILLGAVPLAISTGMLMLVLIDRPTEGLTGLDMSLPDSIAFEFWKFWFSLGVSGFVAGTVYWWLIAEER